MIRGKVFTTNSADEERPSLAFFQQNEWKIKSPTICQDTTQLSRGQELWHPLLNYKVRLQHVENINKSYTYICTARIPVFEPLRNENTNLFLNSATAAAPKWLCFRKAGYIHHATERTHKPHPLWHLNGGPPSAIETIFLGAECPTNTTIRPPNCGKSVGE